MTPAFSREPRPLPAWELKGAKAEGELAGRGGEEAAGGEGAAADEGHWPEGASGPTPAAQTAATQASARPPSKEHALFVWLKRGQTLHTGYMHALGLTVPPKVT